jgi:hypothetical protein
VPARKIPLTRTVEVVAALGVAAQFEIESKA